VANKIGTYLKALAAHDCGVPFYVALPSPTIDWSLTDGAAIPIEERPGDEVHLVQGMQDGGLAQVRISPDATPARNPAFDVTPARLVTGLITERGVCAPGDLARLFPERAG
jgi:methylthioribose-1-phosphate isomerase